MFKLLKPHYSPEGDGAGSPADEKTEDKKPVVKKEIVSDNNLEAVLAKNKELLGEVKKLKTTNKKYTDAIEIEKNKQLLDDGKFKELNAEKDKTISKLNENIINKELKFLAKDFNDPKYISLHRDKFEFDEFGNVTNGEAVLTGLRETDAFLFKSPDKVVPDTITVQPTGFKRGHKFTKSEITEMSDEDFEANRDAIYDQKEKVGIA